MADLEALYSFADTLVDVDDGRTLRAADDDEDGGHEGGREASRWIPSLLGAPSPIDDRSVLRSGHDVYATVVLCWNAWRPDERFVALLRRLGFPAVYAHATVDGRAPGSSDLGGEGSGPRPTGRGLLPSLLARRRRVPKVLRRRRLVLQLPRVAFVESAAVRAPHPAGIADVEALLRSSAPAPGRMRTVVDSERASLVGVRERPTLHRVVEAMFRCLDLADARAVLPSQSFFEASGAGVPAWALRHRDGRVGGGGGGSLARGERLTGRAVGSDAPDGDEARSSDALDPASTATTDVCWATLTILTPPLDGATSNAVPKSAEAAYLRGLQQRRREPVSDAAADADHDDSPLRRDARRLWEEQLFEPSPRAERMLDDVLAHLERRGGVWTWAAHRTLPSLRNEDPRRRPEFVVQGIFPVPLLDRFKHFSRRDAQPMPDDTDELRDAKASLPAGGPQVLRSRLAPLLTTAAKPSRPRRRDAAGSEGEAGEENVYQGLDEALFDALARCSVRSTREPYMRPNQWDAYATPASVVPAPSMAR